jgi:hypothetical protein
MSQEGGGVNARLRMSASRFAAFANELHDFFGEYSPAASIAGTIDKIVPARGSSLGHRLFWVYLVLRGDLRQVLHDVFLMGCSQWSIGITRSALLRKDTVTGN